MLLTEIFVLNHAADGQWDTLSAQGLQWLAADTLPGDEVFLYFAGASCSAS